MLSVGEGGSAAVVATKLKCAVENIVGNNVTVVQELARSVFVIVSDIFWVHSIADIFAVLEREEISLEGVSVRRLTIFWRLYFLGLYPVG